MISCLVLAACATPSDGADAAARAVPEPSLEKIADGVWIHKSYERIEPWGPILSHGMVVKTDAGVFLVDTAWNDADTEKLLGLVAAETGRAPDAAVVTHAHQDKMGGVGALNAAGLRSFALDLSNADAAQRNLAPATHTLSSSPRGAKGALGKPVPGSAFDPESLVYFYPGPGHTRDNVVVYYAPAKILFGGCLIRPGGSTNLGNTADADVARWAETVRNVAAQFPDAEIVIPSHGPPGGRELLDHTIALAEAANE